MKDNNRFNSQLLAIVYKISCGEINFNDEIKKEIKELIEQGASITRSINYNHSPLSMAVVNGLEDIVRLFIDNKANINCPVFYMYQNKVGMAVTPLCLAAEKGLLDMVSLLIDNNASMEMRPNVPISPIHLGAEHNHVKIVKFLLEKGAKFDVAESSFNKTAYQLAEEKGYREVLNLFEQEMHKNNIPNDPTIECSGITQLPFY